MRVAGLRRTKNDIVVEQIKDVLKAESFKDLLMRSLDSMQQLERLKVFRHISLRLDTIKGSRKRKGAELGAEVDLAAAGDESIEVTFVVKELGSLSSTIAANAGTQSGDAVSCTGYMCSVLCVNFFVGYVKDRK